MLARLPGATAAAEVEIRAAPDGAPQVLLGGRPARLAVSLSHRAGLALCAVAPAATALGCDLEVVEPRGDAFVADYLTAAERALVERAGPADRALAVALVWSAKESALKALRRACAWTPVTWPSSLPGRPRVNRSPPVAGGRWPCATQPALHAGRRAEGPLQ